jgi:hypothetical protein
MAGVFASLEEILADSLGELTWRQAALAAVKVH